MLPNRSERNRSSGTHRIVRNVSEFGKEPDGPIEIVCYSVQYRQYTDIGDGSCARTSLIHMDSMSCGSWRMVRTGTKIADNRTPASRCHRVNWESGYPQGIMMEVRVRCPKRTSSHLRYSTLDVAEPVRKESQLWNPSHLPERFRRWQGTRRSHRNRLL